MTVYPIDYDDDATIIRVDDNITEIGGEAINQLRSAVFAIEAELGLNPSGSAGTLENRLDVSLDASGNIKASALTSVGLATLPIVDNQVASSAAIKESKLALDYTTSNLHTLILANSSLLSSLSAFTATINSDLLIHIGGGVTLSDGSTLGRHVASHIDINDVPSDIRDVSFTWDGLKDKNGNLRSATHVAGALLEINDDFVEHQNAVSDAHPATAITVDSSGFVELPDTLENVQEALEAIDDGEQLRIGIHRAVQHSNGIPKKSRSNSLIADGYGQNVVQPTTAAAFLVRPPATSPQDNNVNGDDIVVFNPDNTGFLFDAQFSQVKPGDIITINYGNGFESSYIIDSVRFSPGSEWVVRINGYNLFNSDGYDGYDGYDAIARIDRPLFETNTHGVLAIATANNDLDPLLLGSVIVANPKGASALGIGFDANKIDSTHYNLYLAFYPTGNPSEYVLNLPAIDVTGNAGSTPGQYTLSSIIQATNNQFRASGYNYRFIAYEHNGEFGVMLADAISNASFSVISGELSGSTLITGSYINNIIGDAVDSLDALGFGSNYANLASPAYSGTFSSSQAAITPTKVITPLKNRNYYVDGVRKDNFAYDGYWAATIYNRTVVGPTTVEITYLVEADLRSAELKAGKTIVVQNDVDITDALFNPIDYGRFIIKSINFVDICPPTTLTPQTFITVVNGIHAVGLPVTSSSGPDLAVRLYFSEDSVSFNNLNIVDPLGTAITYNRLHEIYVTNKATTFSHERARMPKQTQTTTLLDTNSHWNIKNISSKLQGFVDSSSSFSRFIRLYILSYDSSTGEFDGYIGKRVVGGPGITNFGQKTTGRKNVPVKFYDHSNIDYLEIEFFDETSSTGVDIMSSNSPRYIDIEIFPSLALDNEIMLLATVEVDNKQIESIVDRREFGSISEVDFTNSAVDFITASDRHIHENGVIRGLDINSIDSIDGSIINMNGGLALVNGKTVPVNNTSIRLPEIRSIGASLPATVTWALCINETGQYKPIIITTSKTQFFATPDGSASYYVPSVSFAELTTQRKDLTIVATVVATINSITLSAKDARRFISNQGFNNAFRVTADDTEIPGTFRTFESMIEWVRLLDQKNTIVHVAGTFSPSSADNTAFATISSHVRFEGADGGAKFYFLFSFNLQNHTYKNIDIECEEGTVIQAPGAVIEFDNFNNNGLIEINNASGFILSNDGIIRNANISSNALGGFVLDSGVLLDNCEIEVTQRLAITCIGNEDITITNCNIVFEPATLITFASGDNINLESTSALFLAVNTSLLNYRIENCTFTVDIPSGTQRPPILWFNATDRIENLIIRNNNFIDLEETANHNAAIAVIDGNISVNSSLIARGIFIENNICDGKQGIYVTTDTNASSLASTGWISAGIKAYGIKISGNTCGAIGFYVTSGQDDFDNNNGLFITNNVCRYIGNSDGLGHSFTNVVEYTDIPSSGNVTISNNVTSWIKCIINNDNPIGTRSNLNISNNTLRASDYTTFSTLYSLTTNSAIIVLRPGTSFYSKNFATITGNSILESIQSSISYGYDIGVLAQGDINITNNIISGFNSSATDGIILNSLNDGYEFYTISNNQIIRNNNTLLAYIFGPTGTSNTGGIVVDNFFDQTTPDGVSSVISGMNGRNWVVERNKNQLVNRYISAANGIFGVLNSTSFEFAGNVATTSAVFYKDVVSAIVQGSSFEILYVTGGAQNMAWWADLSSIVPDSARIVGVTLNFNSNQQAATTGDLQLSLIHPTTPGSIISGPADSITSPYVPSSTKLLTVAPTVGAEPLGKEGYGLLFNCTLNHSSNIILIISDITVYYRW